MIVIETDNGFVQLCMTNSTVHFKDKRTDDEYIEDSYTRSNYSGN